MRLASVSGRRPITSVTSLTDETGERQRATTDLLDEVEADEGEDEVDGGGDGAEPDRRRLAPHA